MATSVKNKTGLLTDDIKRVKQERQRRLKRSRFRKMGELREKDIGFASFVNLLFSAINNSFACTIFDETHKIPFSSPYIWI